MNPKITPIMREARACREAVGMSQDKLSHIAGLSHDQIHRWEQGHHHPSIYAFSIYLEALGKRLRIEDLP